MATKILVVDNEKLIVKGIKYSLEQDGIEVDCAYDGKEAVDAIKKEDYDVVLLDVMLPVYDGLEVTRQVRQFSSVPIIMLTAKSEDMDKIMGLEYGADDYVTKPFNILEVKARIKAILRRNRGVKRNERSEHKIVVKENLVMDTENRIVKLKGEEVNLTAKEYDLLELLVTNPDKVFSREDLLSLIWGYDYFGDERTVDVHVRRVREKIEEDPTKPKYIYTKWGMGYYYKN